MKHFFLVTIVALWACNTNGKIQQPFAKIVDHPELIAELVVPILAEAIVDVFKNRLMTKSLQDGRAPVIGPGLPDPLTLPGITLDLDALNIPTLTGKASLSEGNLTGLSSIVDDLTIFVIPLPRIRYVFDSYIIDVKGTYAVDIAFNETDTGQVHTITGNGVSQANVTKLFLDLRIMTIIINLDGKISVSNVVLDLGFDQAIIYAEGLKINGEDFPLELIDIKTLFDSLWPLVQGPVQEIVSILANGILQGCTLTDIIGGNLECTGIVVPSPVTTTTKTDMTTVNPFPTSMATTPASSTDGAISSKLIRIEFLILAALFATFY